MPGILGLSSGVNKWNINQASSSASMLAKMLQDDLRNGVSCYALERSREVDQLVKRQILEKSVAIKLQLLSAQVQEAKKKWSGIQITSEENLAYEFLSALVRIGQEDASGVAALAYLYSLHVLNETAVGLAARSRVAAATGLRDHIDGIGRLEFER